MREAAWLPTTMKKAEREVLKEKLVKLQKEYMRIKQASADASNRIGKIEGRAKDSRNARRTG